MPQKRTGDCPQNYGQLIFRTVATHFGRSKQQQQQQSSSPSTDSSTPSGVDNAQRGCRDGSSQGNGIVSLYGKIPKASQLFDQLDNIAIRCLYEFGFIAGIDRFVVVVVIVIESQQN